MAQFGRDLADPYLVGSACVLMEDGLWRMWYVSGSRWQMERGRPRHYFHIRYGESADGVVWRRAGRVSIDFRSPDEYAIARPCVVREGTRYRMWYCYRGDAYRIGYAESPDGLARCVAWPFPASSPARPSSCAGSSTWGSWSSPAAAALYLYRYIAYDTVPAGFTALALLVVVMGGFGILTTGVSALYVGKIVEQVKERPLFVVDERVSGPEAVAGPPR